MVDCFLDALKDSLTLFPFLFLIYLLLESVEHSQRMHRINRKIGQGKFAPLYAGAVSLIPECGFSVMAASLFSQGIIALGTLFTVFIVTSDEGIPVLLASKETAKIVLPVMLIKLVYGVAVGFLLNWVFKANEKREEAEREKAFHEHHCKEGNKWRIYLCNPAVRALKILAFVFLVNLAMNALVYFVGEANFTAFLNQRKWLQIVAAPIIGVIPGCGSSVMLATAYQDGVITFSALLSGLTINSGVGLTVLFRQNKNMKQNFTVLFSLYGLSVLLGLLLLQFGL